MKGHFGGRFKYLECKRIKPFDLAFGASSDAIAGYGAAPDSLPALLSASISNGAHPHYPFQRARQLVSFQTKLMKHSMTLD